MAVRLKIDRAGRIVVPKPLRDRFNLKPGASLEVRETADGLLFRPVNQKPAMVQVRGAWVHQGTAEWDVADWQRVIDDDREDRIARLSAK